MTKNVNVSCIKIDINILFIVVVIDILLCVYITMFPMLYSMLYIFYVTVMCMYEIATCAKIKDILLYYNQISIYGNDIDNLLLRHVIL